MTPEELSDYENYRDTYFGQHEKSGRKIETAIEMFDWLFDVYRHTPREKLLELMAGHLDHESQKNLKQKELAEILCERYVMNMMANGFSVKPPRNMRRGPPSQ